MPLKSFFKELKRRNIYKVAMAYAIAGWLIIQICATTFPHLNVPKWLITTVIVIVFVGFPITLLFAWAFELTPEGIKKTSEVVHGESITHSTGRKLNYWIIGMLSAALLLVLAERIWFAGSYSSSNVTNDGSQIASVAVLPFDDFSPTGDQEWFSDGLTEEILNSLARLPELSVSARTSSFLFRNAALPIQKIADSLHVNHIVEGSVRRDGNNLRVTAQLIRADDASHLWSNTYERTMDSVFEVQEDIAEQIATALDVYLDDKKREQMFALGTRNVEAYKAYLKGRKIYDQIHSDQIKNYHGVHYRSLLTEANPWFEKAIARDPDFAAPYYFHHDGYTHYIKSKPEHRIDTLSVYRAHRLLLLDLENAIQHASNPGLKTMYEFEWVHYSGNWSRVPEIIDKLKSNPEAQRAYAMIGGGWSAALLNITGNARFHYQLIQKALKLNPLSPNLNISAIQCLTYFAPVDSLLNSLKEFSKIVQDPKIPYPGLYFAYLRTNQWAKADSLNKMFNAPSSEILLQTAKGNTQKAQKIYNSFPSDSIKKSLNKMIILYALGHKQKANKLAMSYDTTLMGPQNLIFESTENTGGYIAFDPDFLPNVGRMLREAGVQINQVQLGDITLPRLGEKK